MGEKKEEGRKKRKGAVGNASRVVVRRRVGFGFGDESRDRREEGSRGRGPDQSGRGGIWVLLIPFPVLHGGTKSFLIKQVTTNPNGHLVVH